MKTDQDVRATGGIRRMELGDVAAGLRLSSEAGWNQTAEDWRALIQLEPEGCLAIEGEDGSVVATVTVLCYRETLAWLGMVLTRSDCRRRGYARRLVEAAVALADARGVGTIQLDATAMGQPLYESLGFRAEQAVERWSLGTSESVEAGGTVSGWEVVEGLDRESFGADRREVFGRFRERGDVLRAREDGFGLVRAGARANYVGPLIARSEGTARALLRECLAEARGDWYWDLLPGNENAVQLAVGLGFRRERRLVRMSRGPEVRQRVEMTYGIAGFEYG